jgi:hypothetical protein
MGYSLPPDSNDRLRALRAALAERIVAIEGRMAVGHDGVNPGSASAVDASIVPSPCSFDSARHVPSGWPAIDAVLGGGISRTGLHEWWGRPDDVRAVLVQLAWNALLHDVRHHPGAHRHVVWVGRDAWPASGELVRGMRAGIAGMFGAPIARTWPDARLHDRALLVDVPAHDAGARLWAIEQAARCPGVCAVFADGRGLDLPATRRLQLAAQSVLLCTVRGAERSPGARCRVLSACSTRWSVERVVDAAGRALHGTRDFDPLRRAPWLRALHPLAARIPADPAWNVTLERAKGAAAHVEALADGVRAMQGWQWQGVDMAPAPVRAASHRRSVRAARCAAEREARRAEELRVLHEEASHEIDGREIDAREVDARHVNAHHVDAHHVDAASHLRDPAHPSHPDHPGHHGDRAA